MQIAARMIFLVALVGTGVMGCERRGDDGARVSALATQVGNADLENSIRSRFAADEHLKTARLKVDADKDKQVIVLSGTVDSEFLRDKAIDLAKSTQPQLTVQDQIDITPTEVRRDNYTERMAKREWAKAKEFGEKVGNRLNDAWIHGKIVAKLVAQSRASPRTVSVDVTDNVVTLRGTVPDATQKAEAERIAKETGGVERVDNRLRVSA